MNPPQRGQEYDINVHLAELTTVLEHEHAEVNDLRRTIEVLGLQAVVAEDSASQNGVYGRNSSRYEVWF
jgi:hypothetical protein